jgi:hypothetical protein
MNETDCRVCRREGVMDERGICPRCAALVDIARKNIEGAKHSTLPPPTEIELCDDCGFPMKPVLSRPEGPWDFECIKGCRWCTECETVHRFDQLCPSEIELDGETMRVHPVKQ